MRPRVRFGRARPTRLGALVFVAFAFVPLWPAATLIALGALLLVLAASGRWARQDFDAPVAVVAIAVALIGAFAQIANWASPAIPAPLASPPVPVATAAGANLLAAHDVSWLRVWTDEGGLGAYATPVDGAFWRVPALDATQGERVREAIAALEIPLAAGTEYAVSVVLRHDGSAVEATLLERTREGRRRLPTTVVPLGPGLVRLQATVGPFASPVRLRSLHLVDLGGDWTHLDVGWPTLAEPAAAAGYAPRATTPPWSAGIGWWLGLGAAWVLLPMAVRAIARLGAVGAIAPGLLAGLAVQASITLGQVLLAAAGPRRVAGTLIEPNLLAPVALLAALAATIAARRPERVGPIALLLSAVIIAASGSRTGGLGLALGSVAVVVALAQANWGRGSRALAVGLLALGVVTAGASFGLRSNGQWRSDPNVVARFQVWEAGWATAAERPLIGVGHERLPLFFEFSTPSAPGPIFRNDHAHNAFLALAVGFGWPAAIAFGTLLVVLVRRSPRPELASIVLAIAVVVNLVDLSFFHPAFFISVWTACCVPPLARARS